MSTAIHLPSDPARNLTDDDSGQRLALQELRNESEAEATG